MDSDRLVVPREITCLFDGARGRLVLPEVGRRKEGARFGAYVVVQRLGMGATATVYEARHSVLGRPAAIKVLHEHLAETSTMAARFVREGRVASTLRHPNVVDIFDVGVESGLPYLVMELLEGCDFAAWLEAHSKLSAEETLDVLLPVMGALGIAHAAGVIHRDLKPSNIFLSRDGRGETVPKLVDFGLSRWLENDAASALTAADAIVGTLAYMAPEQTEGSQFITERSDQYALAAMLYEAVTGKLPLTGRGTSGLIDAIRTGIIPLPSTLAPTLPAGFDAVLMRALSREPDDRFPDITAFADALLPFASDKAKRRFDESRTPSAPRARVVSTRAQVDESRELPTVILPSEKPPEVIPALPRRPGSTTFSIKGVAYRGLLRFVEKSVPGGMEAVAARIDDPRVTHFFEQTFLAASPYDILPMIPLNSAICAVLGRGLREFSSERSEQQARYDAAHGYRRLIETSTLDEMWKRLPRFGMQYYGFGTCEAVAGGATFAKVMRRGLPKYIFEWYAPMQGAYAAEIVRIAGGKEVNVEISRPVDEGVLEGLSILRFETMISWS